MTRDAETANETAASAATWHAQLVNWLSSPQSYSPAPATVERFETHISQVFVAGELVYKLKKPVRYDFLDFSTLDARERACREEVRLNRRLAPDIYRAVVAVTQETDGGFCFDGRGTPVDWLVQMQRLPADRMLDVLHRRDALTPDDVERLAERLVQFYSKLPPVSITPDAYRTRLLSHIVGNFQPLLSAAIPQQPVRRIQSFQRLLLQLHPELFDRRVEAGRIVEGHGDLRAEHICLTEPIAIFDCIEFNEEFRQLDVADELAFFQTECDFIGAAWVGERLWQRFQELSGDRPAAVLVDFYKAYRAAVRAKVAVLRSHQLTESEADLALHEAVAHLDLADRYAAPHLRPLVLAVGGLSGTGKSTLARGLADDLSAELLRSDVVRRDLFGEPLTPSDVDHERYRPESRETVYRELFRRAAELHRQRIPVVLDATFSTAGSLRAAHAIAEDPQAIFLAVECQCPPEIARERISSRLKAGQDASEARPDVYEQQRAHWESWPAELPRISIDTLQPLAKQQQQVLAHLSQLWTP